MNSLKLWYLFSVVYGSKFYLLILLLYFELISCFVIFDSFLFLYFLFIYNLHDLNNKTLSLSKHYCFGVRMVHFGIIIFFVEWFNMLFNILKLFYTWCFVFSDICFLYVLQVDYG